MKTLNAPRHDKPALGLTLLVLASAISVLAITPALADDHDNRQGNWDNGRGNGHGHGHHHGQQGYYGGGYGYQQPYYRPPVQTRSYIYAPPPVYYPPVISPGLNLVFPINIR